MEEGFQHAVYAVGMLVQDEVQAAMNEFNRKKKEV